VLNRLARVAELTGRDVNDPRAAAELYAAVRARRLHVPASSTVPAANRPHRDASRG
jgi:hypothetical protein